MTLYPAPLSRMQIYTRIFMSVLILAVISIFTLDKVSPDRVTNAQADSQPPTVPEFPEIRYLASNSALVVWSISTDNVGVTSYKVYRNNSLVGSIAASGHGGETKYLDRSLSPSTSYTYKIESLDANGNVSPSVSVSTRTPSTPDKTPPSISIVSPSNGATISPGSTLNVSTNVSDNGSMRSVEFRLYGPNSATKLALSSTDSSSPYTASFNTSGLSSGSYTLKAIARDNSRYTELSSVFNTFVSFDHGNVGAASPVAIAIGSGVITPPPPGAPTVTFTTSPGSITAGQSSTLTWTSTNATVCANNFNGTGINGTKVVSPTQTTSYSITCTGTGGSATKSATVSVSTAINPLPTVTLTAAPTSIVPGQVTVLTWASTNATSCTGNFGTINTNGSKTLTPSVSTTYTISCTGAGSTATDQASVSVSNINQNIAPTLSNVAVSSVSSSQATITWTTDVPSDSQIRYGVNTSFGSLTPLDTNLTTSHSAKISKLRSNTTYYYRVISKNSKGLSTESNDRAFTTNSKPGKPINLRAFLSAVFGAIGNILNKIF